jgi:hypothetical protein
MTVTSAKRKRIKLHLHEAQEYASRKGAFAHAGERSLRSNTCLLILRLIFELGNLYYFASTGKPLKHLKDPLHNSGLDVSVASPV